MRITLTPEQYAELDNDFWHIPYTVEIDGITYDAYTDDDGLREIPVGVLIGVPGQNEDGSEYYIAHPALTWEDEVMLKAELDKRAAFTAEVAASPKGQRPKLRQDKRTQLRTEARQYSRMAARAATRVADRREARRLARIEYRRKRRAALDAVEVGLGGQ